jgi:hypothetical protein
MTQDQDQEEVPLQPEEQQRTDGATIAPRATGGGLSTADMARAMDHQADGDGDGTAATAAASARAGDATEDGRAEPLFPEDEAERFRARWTDIQAGFVDEPRQAVEQADELVAEVIQRLAQVFAGEREALEGQWGQGDDGDTEGLRVALRRYRSFFERLLSA